MTESTRRIPTTHVGSLIRPPELVEFMRAKLEDAPYDAAAFDTCLKQSVREVVRQQTDTGIDIVNDGEFGKSSWFRYIGERLAGFEFRAVPGKRAQGSPSSGHDFERFRDFYVEYNNTREPTGPAGKWVVTGPIAYKGQATIARDIGNLKNALGEIPAHAGFLPVVAPASANANLRDEYYGSEEKLVFALADALHEEYAAVAASGLLVQVDDAWLTAKYDNMVPPWTMIRYREWAELQVEALNRALKGIPETQTRYHVCWGSWNGPHTTDIPLREIVDLILKVRVGAYSLESANPRHEHEWRVWETIKLPQDRKLIPGVVSHVTNVVEHPELVADRLIRLAELVGRERVIGSTDCGFAQSAFYRRVHPSIMWAKLRSLVDGAGIATRRLWH
jgi:5-methyltetrahydropteroyltriglutamate--homocysteine methyltransferase